MTLTILIPRIKAPDAKDSITTQLKNICDKIKENQNLKIVWIVFQPEKIRESKGDMFEIINFHNYKNAFEIIDKVRPDAILVDGSMDFQNVAFVMAGKSRKIPTISTFFRYLYMKKFLSKFSVFKSRINQSKSYPPPTGDYNKEKVENLRGLRFFSKKIFFLFRTLKEFYSNKFEAIRFTLFYVKLMITKYIPTHESILGDLNLCSNSEWAKRLESIGCKNSAIVVVGNTEFDDVYQKIHTYSSDVEKTKNNSKVLFCPSPLHEHGLISKKKEFENIIKAVNIILKQSKNEIAIKINPSSSSLIEYKKIENKLIKNIPIYQNENVIELIKNYDVIISYGTSTVILYSALLKKPTIILDLFQPEVKVSEFFKKDAMIKCDNVENLVEAIIKSQKIKLSELNYEDYIQRHLGKFDGNCSQRSADAILELLNKK